MLPEGRLLGHYRLIHPIGSGGMGEVYSAEDIRINRQVAIKVVHAETEPYLDPVAMQDAMRLFHREMRAITMLDHPYILSLYDFGEENDGNMILTYMVMPLREEGSLTDWQKRRGKSEALTPNEVAHFIMQAAEALQYAHNHHLIHQDVKPSNFLVRKRLGHVLPDLLLTDFGIAKMMTAATTSSQSIRGTPAFMAPEQWEGHPQPATDQYALAVMAYVLLTGRTPFSGRMEQIMRQHFIVQPQPPSRFNPAILAALDAVILRALEKEPAKRFPSIFAFAQAFQEALQAGCNQDATVTAPKKGEIPLIPDETTEPEEISLPASAPLSSAVSPVKSDEAVLAVLASSPDPSKQIPVVADTESETPKATSLVPPAPIASRKVSSVGTSRLILVLSVVVLVIIASVMSVSIRVNQQNQMNASATAQASEDATSTEQANETVTAQAQATATAQVIANNPYPSYLSGSGTLTFVDPLNQESGSQWGPYHDSGGGCQFTGGAYHASEQQSNLYRYCSTGATFSNFAFEVQSTITEGDCGGMIFRYDGNENYYFFQVCQNGSYDVSMHMSHSGSTNLGSGNSSALYRGLGQQNRMALVANGSSFTFYVNMQQVIQLQDNSYTSGRIGLVASAHSQATDVAYSNARLWTL